MDFGHRWYTIYDMVNDEENLIANPPGLNATKTIKREETEPPVQLTLEQYTVLIHEIDIDKKPSGTRYMPAEYASDQTKLLGEDRRLNDRARLALEAMNFALDELGYTGEILPIIAFNIGLTIDGVPRPGAYQSVAENLQNRPAIYIEIGPDILTKGLDSESIAMLRNQNLPDDFISKLALITTCREEIYHFYDDQKGLIPPTTRKQVLQMSKEENEQQPHEVRARNFASKIEVGQLSALGNDLRKPMF